MTQETTFEGLLNELCKGDQERLIACMSEYTANHSEETIMDG